jgi:hypothetical protein
MLAIAESPYPRQLTGSSTHLCDIYAVPREPEQVVSIHFPRILPETYQATSSIPNICPLTDLTRVKVCLCLMDTRAGRTSIPTMES